MRAVSKPACSRSARAASGRHDAHFRQRLGGRQLHFQPLLEFVFVRPDAAHFRPRITRDQNSKTSVGRDWLAISMRRRQAAPFQRLRGHQAHDFRMIVVLAEMPQDQARGHPVEIPQQKIAHHVV